MPCQRKGFQWVGQTVLLTSGRSVEGIPIFELFIGAKMDKRVEKGWQGKPANNTS